MNQSSMRLSDEGRPPEVRGPPEVRASLEREVRARTNWLMERLQHENSINREGYLRDFVVYYRWE